MTNTMADLREECATRLRETIHGREIDMMENTVKLPHMLGITTIGAIHTHKAERNTLLDSNHEFWQDFEEEVNTDGKAQRKVESAVRSLRADDIFRMTYPYGEEADIVYCEVDEMQPRADTLLTTECGGCGETIDVPLSLDMKDSWGDNNRSFYTLRANIDCPHCDFSTIREASMNVA